MTKVFNIYAEWRTPSGGKGKHESKWHGHSPKDVLVAVMDMLQQDKRKRVASGLFISISESTTEG